MCHICHSQRGKPAIMETHAIAMQRFPGATIHSYALILLALWATEALFHVGMLTKQKNYRIINAVIVRVHGLLLIIYIMRHVS